MQVILQRHSQSYQHDYQLNWQVLDADMTGRPCGKKANFASKGYFAKQRNRRGRQEGYVIGTWYEEIIVVTAVCGHNPVEQSPAGLDRSNRTGPGTGRTQTRRTILRIDFGVAVSKTSIGSWAGAIRCMPRIIPVCGPKPWPRVSASGSSIPNDSRRQIGWVTVEPELYGRPVQRIAVRCRKKNGQWGYGRDPLDPGAPGRAAFDGWVQARRRGSEGGSARLCQLLR